jgi:hypothetical protein
VLVTKVRMDGQFFFLAEGADQSELEAAIVAAVQKGGDFVSFPTHGHGTVSVLMTPHVAVRFERVERTSHEVDAWAEDPPPVDLDLVHGEVAWEHEASPE